MVLRRDIRYQDYPLSKQPRKLPDILSTEEVASIIKASGNIKHRAILILAYGAGLRSSEIAQLKAADIDSKRMQIHIRNGKGGKDRYVVLSEVMLTTLRSYWRSSRTKIKSDWLFPGQYPNKAITTSSIGSIFKKAKARAKIIHKRGGIHSFSYPNLNKIQTFCKNV